MVNQEFETPQDALAHYGVKGMKWGVRKDRKSSGDGGSSSARKNEESDGLKDASDAFYAKKDSKELQAEGERNLKAQIADDGFPTKASARRAAKAEGIEKEASEYDQAAKELADERDSISGNNLWNKYQRRVYNDQIAVNEKVRDDLLKKAEQVREGKLTDNQKKLIVAGGIAAVAVAGLYARRQYDLRNAGITKKESERLAEENRRKTSDEWSALFGDAPDFGSAKTAFGAAGPGFYTGLKNGKVWDRPEFTIPESTIFQRLSDHAEDSSGYGREKGAYATFLNNDKKLYGASKEFGGKKYTVNFTVPGGTKVPSHQTVLSHLKKVTLTKDDTMVASLYHQMAGASWSTPTSMRLFESLREAGYSAIVDDMDAGFLGDLPVVFFGKASTATSTPRTRTQRTTDSIGLLKVTGKYA